MAVQARARGPWWAQLACEDAARAHRVREVFLQPCRRGWRRTLLHIPGEAGACTLTLFGADPVLTRVRWRVLSRVGTALRLLASGWRRVPGALRGDARGRLLRLRLQLGQAPARAGEAPPYDIWLQLYPPSPPAHAGRPRLLVESEPSAEPPRPGEWVLLVARGERLHPDALDSFAAAAADALDFVYADCDRIAADGRRFAPFFKPGPGLAALRTGLLTRGACLVRWPAGSELPAAMAPARLALALRAWPRVGRIAAILTHLESGEPANVAALAAVVVDEGGGQGLAVEAAAAGDHVRARPRPSPSPGLLSVLVPSACRTRHVAHCLRRMAASLADIEHEILVAVGGAAPDPAVLRALARIPRLRLLEPETAPFNYPAANNRAAAAAQGPLLLFLNDDVAPADPAWFAAMRAHMQEPAVGAVGARLLYGDGSVQHDGVILGLGGLAEHAGRGRQPGEAAGGWFGTDRECAAVTAACMLVRAEAWRAVGGFDPRFAIALNDVDFCLRLGAAGWRIVQCGTTMLTHYESLSLGRHYAAGRAALEAVEVGLLRARWGGMLAADPYYNPQAALAMGREWQPAFPPRDTGIFATGENSFAAFKR